MAVLGAQLVITLIMVSVIQKLNPRFSFAKWILCSTGLYRYLHPTDDELRTKGGVPKEKPQKGGYKGHKHQQNGTVNSKEGQFHIARSIDIELQTAPVVANDVVYLRYFTEYQWLVDFSIYAAIVYTASEVYHYFIPLKNEVNLSMVWCLLVIFFAIKLLSSLTVLYFQSEESIGERSMVIVACLVYLLIAMIVLIIDESILETGLENAYTSFNASASKFLSEQGLQSSSLTLLLYSTLGSQSVLPEVSHNADLKIFDLKMQIFNLGENFFTLSLMFVLFPLLALINSIYQSFMEEPCGNIKIHYGPASKIVIKFFIALGCGIMGALFTFPGLRMAKMHWDSLNYCRDNKVLQILLNISFILPFILVILWIRPISRDYLTVRVFQGMDQPLIKPHVFETLRLLLVIFVVIIRFSLMPIYLQSYLNLAHDKIMDLRKEAGRITNFEYQKKVSSIFYYLCVVTLQFVAPLVLCLYLTLMYKSLGGYSWTGIFTESVLQHECSADSEQNIAMPDDFEDGSGMYFITEEKENEFNILESAQNLQNSFVNLKNVFSTEVYKGFLGFATWWSYFTLFATSSLGIVYQSYFNKT